MIQKILSLAVYAMIFAFAVFMILKGLFLVKLNQRQLMAMMPFTMSGPYVILPLSGTFIAIHSLTRLSEFFARHHTEWRD